MSEQTAEPVSGELPTLSGLFDRLASVIRDARRRQRKRRIIVTVALAVIVSAAIYWETTRLRGGSTVGRRETVTITHFRLGAAPVAVTTAGGSLWVVEETANGMRAKLAELNPKSGRRLAEYPIGGAGPDFGAVTRTGNVLWATAGTHVVRVDANDPSAPTVRATIPGEGAVITVAFGSVWVAAIGPTGNVIERLNSKTLALQGRIRLEMQPVALRAGLGSLWLATTSGLWRINTTSNRLEPTWVGGSFIGLTMSSDRLLLIQQSPTLIAVDGRARVRSQLQLPFDPGSIASSTQGLWITDNCACMRGTVSLISDDGRALFRRRIGETPVAVTASRSEAWVATFADGTVSRLDIGH